MHNQGSRVLPPSLPLTLLSPAVLMVQVPIENQVKTIVWFTIVGNAFFVVRATLEVILAVSFTILWRGTFTIHTRPTHACQASIPSESLC